jgi:putative peptidoglycan lipid II flippase
LQANQHFLLPAMAPSLYNVGMIFGALFLAPKYGVHGLVYGVIIGAALHLVIQIPGLIKYQFRWTPSLDIRNSGLIEALKLMAPRLVTMFGIQMMYIARDNFASRLDQVGAVTSLTYGWMIMQVPETLLGTAIATALLPSLAEFAARKDWVTFRETIEKALRVMLVLTIPAGAVIAAGLRPLVAAAFHFDDAGTDLLTLTSRIYMLTLVGYVVQETMARAFYSRKEPLMPLFSVVVRMAVYLLIGVTAVTLFRPFGAPVLAAAELSLTVEAIFMLNRLNKRLSEPLRLFPALGRGLAAALLSGFAAYGLAVYLPGPGYITALAGMAVGGVLAVGLVWSEARMLFHL